MQTFIKVAMLENTRRREIMRVVISILLITMLILGGGFFTFGTGVENKEKEFQGFELQDSYIAHEPIRINNDTQFTNAASLENWSGDGSAASLFIIENYSINGRGYGYGIYIGNTTLHFVIRNCYIYSSNGGSLPYFGGIGIILYRVSNAVISGNRLQSSQHYGLYGKAIHDTEISSNLISSNYNGIYLTGAQSDTSLVNNTFHVNRYAGLYLHDSSGTVIRNNTFQNNRMIGAYLYISQGIVMKNNTFSGDGIFIKGYEETYWDSHSIDTSNTVNGKPIYYLSGENGGIAPQDGGELIIASSQRINLGNQTMGHTTVSILVGYSSEITIRDTTVHNHTLYGIFLYVSENCMLQNVSVKDNMQGMVFELSNNVELKNSTFSNNMRGLWLVNSQRITISGNNFEHNNILISGNSAEYWDSHTIDASNKANGKTIRYVTNNMGEYLTVVWEN